VETKDKEPDESEEPDQSGKLKVGFLEKRGGGSSKFGSTSWKKRYFVLEVAQFSYYENELKNAELLGSFTFHRVDSVEAYEEEKPDPKHPWTFRYITRKRFLLMRAESETEMKQWIKVIKKCIDEAAINKF